MNCGIYIVGNDRVADNAIALCNSIRLYDPDVPIVLIPFNDDCEYIAAELQQRHGVRLFPDLELVRDFTWKMGEIFDRDFLALPNKMRKLVAWFGPLDAFLYIDTDIIVFDRIARAIEYLPECDFLCCDFHHKGRGLKDIFADDFPEKGMFAAEELERDVFNSGFWGSRKGVVSLEEMESLLRECAAHREYFDFSQKTTDQPILNYIVLKSMPRRLNLVRVPEYSAGSWAGSPHFEEKDGILYDRGKRLKYLHWAGTSMKPGGPYRELWERYRYLHEPKPAPPPPPSPWQPIWQKAKQKFKRLLGK